MVDSFFKLKERLIWETKIPPLYGGHFTSGLFTFLNSKWRLDIICTPELRPCYSLNLVPYGDHVIGIGKFVVKTCFINDKVGTKNVFEDQTVFEYTIERRRYTTLWQLSAKDLSNMYPDIQNRGYITIACAFCESNGSILPVTLRTDVTPSSDTDQSPESQNPNPTIRNSPLVDDSLSHDFSKLLNKKLMSDIQLKCGERTFSAHKTILAARSSVFSTKFQNKTAESSSGTIYIEDIDDSLMDIFLKYLYSGNIHDDLTEEIALNLYEVGEKYAMYGLMKICSNFLTQNMKKDNFLNILSLADTHSDERLMGVVVDFVTKHVELLRTDSWLQFSKTNLKAANEIYQKYIEFLSKST